MFYKSNFSHNSYIGKLKVINLEKQFMDKGWEAKIMAYGYKARKIRWSLIVLFLVIIGIFLGIKFTTREVVDKINRVEDLNVLSNFLQENYLYKEISGIDLEPIEEQAREKVESTILIKEHQAALMSYVSAFKQWPTRLLTKEDLMFDSFLLMQGQSLQNPVMEKLLKKESVQAIYELEAANYHEIERYLKNQKEPTYSEDWISIKVLQPGSVVYAKINSFNIATSQLKDYQTYFYDLLKPYNGYDKIILDVRHSKGYGNLLWQQVILPTIASENLSTDYYGVFKGEALKDYYENMGHNIYNTQDLDPTDYEAAYSLQAPYVYKERRSVEVLEDPINFTEKYLIVDKDAYGAAVQMTDFVHRTQAMTIVGERTRPRQISFSPMLYDLPSGYIVYLDGVLAVNKDQSLNIFQGVEPDYTVEYLNVIEDGLDKAIKFVLDL